LAEFDPHAVCTDLHLGAGPSGIALLNHVARERPWVGLVILTSHQSVESATGSSTQPPPGTVSLVKSTLESLNEIGQAVLDAISAAERPVSPFPVESVDGAVTVSPAQAEILSLIAAGYTNAAIARERQSSVRSVEMMVARTFRALGIDNDPDMNPRVLATKIWQAGKVVVR
jgi:DNA-binding NarL/FixJ family response regulator